LILIGSGIDSGTETNAAHGNGLLDRLHLTAAPIQRRPIIMVSEGDRKINDHADRASDGLPQGFSPAFEG
jgi:hypothetical protein